MNKPIQYQSSAVNQHRGLSSIEQARSLREYRSQLLQLREATDDELERVDAVNYRSQRQPNDRGFNEAALVLSACLTTLSFFMLWIVVATRPHTVVIQSIPVPTEVR